MDTNSVLPWLVPLFPLAGFLWNAFMGSRTRNSVVTAVASSVVWLAFLCCAFLALQLGNAPEKRIFSTVIPWLVIPSGLSETGFSVDFSLVVDPLSVVLMLVITGVGGLIHGYSSGYMSHEKAYSRYFAYLNLFVFFMLLLVMASNLVMMFVGWEGVGLASYLLIGFWSDRPAAAAAAKKAFVVNRVGDAALMVAFFLIYKHFGTLDFFGESGILTESGLEQASASGFAAGALVVHLVPLLLFAGATGKSAQFPLHVWLPDAMEGPTPVSALIHAATMVTAGVYLLSRCNVLFSASPVAMSVVAVVGVATAFIAATIGLVQNDIKKVLAYSTVSQLGFMFVACGAGAFGAALFHVVTHAFFKALLFLGAGSVIHAMGGEQDMRKMGGLAKRIPSTYRMMLIGTIAISGIPPLAGFWSKDEILAFAYARHPALWAVGIVTALLTAVYMWRLMALTFAGSSRCDESVAAHIHESPTSMLVPLMVLGFFSTTAGFANAAPLGIHWFGGWLDKTVGISPDLSHGGIGTILLVVSTVVAVGGSFASYRYHSRRSDLITVPAVRSFLTDAWQFDAAYASLFVRPGERFARFLNRHAERRGIHGVIRGVGATVSGIARLHSSMQTGRTRNYSAVFAIGAALLLIGAVVGLTWEGKLP